MSLTDDWKAGKLKWHKSYYCQNKKGEIVVATLIGEDTLYSKELGGKLNFGYWEVLAPCDYEELQRLKETNRTLQEINGIKVFMQNEVLKSELIKRDNELSQKVDYINEIFDIKETYKGLLKECLAHLSLGEIGTSVTPLNILITRINAAIGESEE